MSAADAPEMLSRIDVLTGLLNRAHIELNAIRARDGVPYTSQGYKSGVDEAYFSSLVDQISEALGDDCAPWDTRGIKAIEAPLRKRAEDAEALAADLAAKLAAAGRERKYEHELGDDLLNTCGKLITRADRAEAALVAAQEAMREAAAREIEEAPLLENADMQTWAKRDMELAAIVRALPIPTAHRRSAHRRSACRVGFRRRATGMALPQQAARNRPRRPCTDRRAD